MTHRTDGGDAVVSAFNAVGADYIFSSPGSEWAPVWESLARRHRDGLPCPRYLDLTHETVAVGMATGYGLVTRRAQGVLLHAGPGLLQGSMAVHGALLAGVPMVVTSSESITYGDGPGPDPGGQWYRNLSVVGGPHVMAAPFTKWSNQAASVHTLTTMITRSAEMAARAPAGPVYLNIPLEVLLDPWDGPDPKPVAAHGTTVSAAEDMQAVLELLAGASNPVIITETTGREAGGMAALVAFAEAMAIPVVEPGSAVCANFPRDHELHAGGEIEPFVDTADVIVLLNCRAPFYPPSRRPARAKIVVIDEVPQRPHVVYQVLNADFYLEGGVTATLRELAVRAREQGLVSGSTFRSMESAAVTTAEWKAAGTLDPVQVVATLREVIGEDSVVVDETITHSRIVQRHLRRATPDSYFYVQGGLGQGIAVALGVKLATPDRPVVLTIGDGAFLYNPIVQSLQAARANGLPLLIVVFNNHEYRSMKMNHLRFYPRGAAVDTGEFLGNDLSDQPDLAALADPFAMHAETVERADELAPALDRALKAVRGGTTAIVNVRVSR
ncbi:thiamine pyrophosphate-dependent acetolactate synthase large subunit-like protein [Actinoplanes campanulatus]|uniref:Thiamine pyrophosphate-dependent acetolactate synthase large subunit-like protein n=1 Tax=Actinoplanes campanulatus TaxID=113559 RepID=A0A7W5FE23_9ACTN|nr:thiamine pyrophosphate-dependent enzyme [Actinoplanes campanulatus]MBB3094872.1 thiamine pyrophosphate-dependent acetolactate synthase large subunit-like protein [Actinoplanes campanulatus]GGN08056.1 benzoylformate decarboxylase [Actinoplanes campanulatus]GID36166.1 benzoylformate decarboxylase [Actinoplanes campanulatus]